MKRFTVAALGLLLMACGTAPIGSDEEPTTTTTEAEGIPRRATPDEIFDAILADLIERTGANPDAVIIVRDEEATWNDGSMGCPEPGVLYTQAIVTGYWVVLMVDDVEYDYRAAQSGHFVHCPSPTPGGAPTG